MLLQEIKSREETQSLKSWIHRWGCSISEMILESTCHHFRVPEIEGFIGYRIVHGCAIILGDPICAFEKKTLLAESFQRYCDENNRTCLYFITSEQFSKWAINHICKILIEVGEEMVFDPFIDPTLGHNGHRLRNAISHAQSLGLGVKEYTSQDREIEKSIIKVGKNWLNARKGPQIYLGDLNFFENRANRRWFYLEDEKQNIIGMALLSRLEAYQGWLLKFLMVVPDAPRGSSELLMISVLETLRKEECHFVTYGMIPSESLGEIAGLGKLSTVITKGLFKLSKWIFHLNQRKIYWKKFQPRSEKSYILFSSPTIGIKEILALANTMKINL